MTDDPVFLALLIGVALGGVSWALPTSGAVSLFSALCPYVGLGLTMAFC